MRYTTVKVQKMHERYQTILSLVTSISLCLVLKNFYSEPQMLSPMPVHAAMMTTEVVKEVRVIAKEETIDQYIADAVSLYMPKNRQSEMKMIMHCLAHRESGHGATGKPTDKHGDGGLAGGPFQFHEGTWIRMRGQMKKAGLIEDIGSRYSLKDATYTTVWAIREGRALEWGPILRDAKGSDFASCQKPSWYTK